MNTWTRETAFNFLVPLEAKLAAEGYHCALAGGVMYKGSSTKDLDVIVYPHDRENCLPVDAIWHFLVDLLKPGWAGKAGGSTRDGKDVRMMYTKAGRIDFFFLK